MCPQSTALPLSYAGIFSCLLYSQSTAEPCLRRQLRRNIATKYHSTTGLLSSSHCTEIYQWCNMLESIGERYRNSILTTLN